MAKVTLTVTDGIATIELCNLDKRNAMGMLGAAITGVDAHRIGMAWRPATTSLTAQNQPTAGESMDFGPDRIEQLCPAPDPNQRKPHRFTVPPGAVDTHAHVVGTTFIPNRSYTPPPASGDQYLGMLDATGMTYGVLVQISVHGTDNDVMLKVVDQNRDRLRAVAVVGPDVSDTELSRLAVNNVVGLRLNTLAAGGVGLDKLPRYNRICREMGWHLQFLTNTHHLTEAYWSLTELTEPYVIDHWATSTSNAGPMRRTGN
jgi:2-pyrone-4,6-dicarboxylate lactonase